MSLHIVFDRLIVFQSAPLALVDAQSNSAFPQPDLDCQWESGMLQDSLKDAATIGAKIDVLFGAATIYRLSAFFAQRMIRVMHFSGHGHPNYLALEDERGGLQALGIDDLIRLVSVGGGNLKVVFVCGRQLNWLNRLFENDLWSRTHISTQTSFVSP